MTAWVATFAGALDLKGHELSRQGFELLVCPSRPAEPRYLWGAGAETWRQLAEGSGPQGQPETDTVAVLHELETMGLAGVSAQSSRSSHSINRPWLLSVHHELVYALLAEVASQQGIDIIFIKGPALHAQRLRHREHSGDVDCWVRPGDDLVLAEAMNAWGWTAMYSAFTGTGVAHSLTLNPGSWGCAIDVHSSFPGMTIDPVRAFDLVRESTEKRAFASRTVDIPTKTIHAVIAALHDVRPNAGQRPTADQLETARYALAAAGPEVVQVVNELGAGYVLQDLLRRVFPDAYVDTSKEPRDWSWRATASSPRRYAKAWLLVPWRQKPLVLLRLVWPKRGMAGARETPSDAHVPSAASIPSRLRRLVTAAGRFVRGL